MFENTTVKVFVLLFILREKKSMGNRFLTYAYRISSKILIIMLPAFTFLLCFNVQSVSFRLLEILPLGNCIFCCILFCLLHFLDVYFLSVCLFDIFLVHLDQFIR